MVGRFFSSTAIFADFANFLFYTKIVSPKYMQELITIIYMAARTEIYTKLFVKFVALNKKAPYGTAHFVSLM